MKLSTRQELLKESTTELKRLRKLAGLKESRPAWKSFLFEDIIDMSDVEDMTPEDFEDMGTRLLVNQFTELFDKILYAIKQGKNSSGETLPKAVNKKKALDVIQKEKEFVIKKIKAEKLASMQSLKKYFLVDFQKKMQELGFFD